MSLLARWCHRHRVVTVLLWVAALVGLAIASNARGTTYDDTMSMPSSGSVKAMNLLKSAMPSASGDQDTVVWSTSGGTVEDAAPKARMTKTLAEIARAPGVASVTSPFTASGAAQVSKDHTVAYATVIFDDSAQDLPKGQVNHVIDLAEQARGDGLDVQMGGAAVSDATREVGGATEIIGVIAALLILGLIFRSVWAAALPVVTGVAGVGTGALLVGQLSHALSIASVAPTLGALVGLGVGIDYALFIVNRHRKGLMAGMDVGASVERALNTSGRAVLFAGSTVIVALLGMTTLGLGFLNGVAIGAALTVLMTVLAAITLLPALLGLLGPRVLSPKQRRTLGRDGRVPEKPNGVWATWAAAVQARPWGKVLLAVAMIAVVALPVFSIRLGTSDAGNNPKSTTTRQAYDLLAKGFGPGFNGPLTLVAQTSGAADDKALTALESTLRTTPGVARVQAAPLAAGQRLGVVTVVPTTSPQDQATTDLIHTLRDDVIPRAEAGTTLKVLVGGSTAQSDDFSTTLVNKLPSFIAIIVCLGCLLMMLAFRSILVPLIGLAMNLLTLGVAYGAIVAVFQWGWGSDALGAGGPGPVESFAPVMITAILFGLSMDYQVFLISRMHEEWHATGDNRRAVRVGQAETGQVITAAAVIMACVFSAFIFGGQRMIAEFGLGLALAVLMDVFLVRMIIVPSLMHRFGRANWWLPSWLDRVLPHLAVEGAPEREEEPAREPLTTVR